MGQSLVCVCLSARLWPARPGPPTTHAFHTHIHHVHCTHRRRRAYLSMDVPADGDWAPHGLHVALLDQDFLHLVYFLWGPCMYVYVRVSTRSDRVFFYPTDRSASPPTAPVKQPTRHPTTPSMYTHRLTRLQSFLSSCSLMHSPRRSVSIHCSIIPPTLHHQHHQQAAAAVGYVAVLHPRLLPFAGRRPRVLIKEERALLVLPVCRWTYVCK